MDTSRIQIGSVGDLGQPEISGKEELLHFRFTFDDMDAPIIPRQGVRAEVKADWLLEAPEAKEEF